MRYGVDRQMNPARTQNKGAAAKANQGAGTLQGVSTALRLLRLMTQHPSVGVRETARLLDVTPTVAQRLLRTLEAEGFLHLSPSSRTYSLTPLVLEIAHAFISRQDLTSLAKHFMTELHEYSSETIALYSIHDGLKACIAEIQSPHTLRMVAKLGTVSTVSNGATDKVFRAFADPAGLKRINARLREKSGAGASKGLTSPAELREVRERGWATSFGARVPGSAAVSAAVPTPNGLYVLSLFGPQPRMEQLGMDEATARLTAAARELAGALGWLGVMA